MSNCPRFAVYARSKAKLCRFATVYVLLMFQNLLSVTKGIHKYLHEESLDLAQAVQLKIAVHDTLKNYCTSAKAVEMYDRTKALRDGLEIEQHTTTNRGSRNGWMSMRLSHLVAQAQTSAQDIISGTDCSILSSIECCKN